MFDKCILQNVLPELHITAANSAGNSIAEHKRKVELLHGVTSVYYREL